MNGTSGVLKTILLLAVSAGLSSGVLAQPAGDVPRRDPADPRAAVAPVGYESPFAPYRPFAEGAVGPWKSVNDEVGRIGGWKVYAREAQTGPGAAPVQAQPPAGSPRAPGNEERK
jgi:hypothetical protein